jgi:ADP-heptose:LPS heptosyltransferase
MRVLIVTLDNIGDTFISLAIREALKGQPGIHTAFWTKEYSGGVIKLAGTGIEHYHCDPFWDRSPGAGKGNKLSYLKTLLKIRKARFDAALILHSNWRKNLSCLLAGIGKRYAMKGAFSTDTVTPPGEHELDACRALVQALTGKDPGELAYPLTPDSYDATPETARLFSQGRWAVIHPFSGNSRRNLPLSSWADIVRFLGSGGRRILVNASPREKEQFSAVVPGGSTSGTADMIFSCDLGLDIKNLAFAVSRAEIFIGNNSGPLHMASALGTPCVGIFQESWVAIIAPRGKFPPELAVFRDHPSEISASDIILKAGKALERGAQPPANC